QYLGAGRRQRIGPAVWQALWFSLAAGIAFLGLVPLAPMAFSLSGHSPGIQSLEVTYFQLLCFSAPPVLVTAAASGFFSGRGDTWRVLLIDAVGLAVNASLAFTLIYGRWGMPELGIAGAGVAPIAGSTASAVL